MARAIGVQPINAKRRPAGSTPAPHKRRKQPPPPQSPEASARISLTPDDCLPEEQVAEYPGKNPAGNNGNPGKPDNPNATGKSGNPGHAGKKAAKFKSLAALALEALAEVPAHEPRDHRRVRGSQLLDEYPDESSSNAQGSTTDSEQSSGQQGSQGEADLLNTPHEQGTATESDVLCEGSLAKLLEDVRLQAVGPDINGSQGGTKQGEGDDMSAGKGGATEHEYQTREAVPTGGQHVPAGEGTCDKWGQQGDIACDNSPASNGGPASIVWKKCAAGQQVAVCQGAEHGGISASFQMDESADADVQRGWLQLDSGKYKAQDGVSADLPQQLGERTKDPARARGQKTVLPEAPCQNASTQSGDDHSSMPAWPPVSQTAVPTAAACMMPGGEPEKAHHESHNTTEVLHGSGSEGADHKSSNVNSHSMTDDGYESVSAILPHANGTLFADSNFARLDSAVSEHITEMQYKNRVLRYELAHRSRLLEENSVLLAAKKQQLAETERQLAEITRQLAMKSREYTALAAGVEEAIRCACVKDV